MAKYTIEVDGIYAINILAAIAELLESRDEGHLGPYLLEALPSLFAELNSSALQEWGSGHEAEWEKIAEQAEYFAGFIRHRLNITV